MRFWLRALLAAIVVVGITIGGLSYAYWDQTVLIASMAINYVRYWSAPAGTLETEVAQTGAAAQPSASMPSAPSQVAPGETEGDWPSYNKTLTSNRFSQLSQINKTNADKLKVVSALMIQWPRRHYLFGQWHTKDRRCKRSHRNSVANRNHNRQGIHTWIGVRRGRPPHGAMTVTDHRAMSALPPKADMCGATSNVRFDLWKISWATTSRFSLTSSTEIPRKMLKHFRASAYIPQQFSTILSTIFHEYWGCRPTCERGFNGNPILCP